MRHGARCTLPVAWCMRVISLCGAAASAARRSVQHAVHGTVPCGYSESAVCASRKANAAERAQRPKGQTARKGTLQTRTHWHTDLAFCVRLNVKRGPSSSARVSGASDSRRPSSGGRSNTKAEANRAIVRWAPDDELCPYSQCWPDRRASSLLCDSGRVRCVRHHITLIAATEVYRA